ncbi:DUF1345 domain-containing protein, partial [bacterium]
LIRIGVAGGLQRVLEERRLGIGIEGAVRVGRHGVLYENSEPTGSGRVARGGHGYNPCGPGRVVPHEPPSPPHPSGRSLMPRGIMYARTRLTLMAGVGVVVLLTGPLLLPVLREEVQLRWLLAWSAVCLTFLSSVWLAVRPLSPDETRALAEREDNGRAASRTMLTIGSIVSLFAVGSGLIRGHELAQQKSPLETVVVLGTLVTVALTWLLVHVDAMLHYARLYYDGPDGGIEFGDEPPSYEDFAYLAFTVGMTFQVSDTNITDRHIRRAVFHHAILSYLFGTILVALTINGVASLAS